MRLLKLIFASLLFAAIALGTFSFVPSISNIAIAEEEGTGDMGDEATEGASGEEAEAATPGAEEAQDGTEDAAPAP